MSSKPRIRLPNPIFKSLHNWAVANTTEDTPTGHIIGIVLCRLGELGDLQRFELFSKIKTDADWTDVLNEIGPPANYEE